MKNKPYTKQSINWIATFLLVAFAIMQQTSAIAQCNNDPVFTQTPACGSTISATVGTALTIFIGTSDADGNIHMTLSSGTLPSGAVMSPPLPEFDNPPSSNFQWTPGSGAVGNHTITFTVEDDCGVQTTCSFTINVTNPCSGSGSPVFVAPTPTCGSTMTATPGVPLTFSVSASDVGHPSNPITLTMSGNSAALSTAILSPTLPVTGNPVNASFSWTPTFADIGLQQAGFKIHDPCTNGNEFCFYDIDVVSPCVGQGSPVFVAPTPPCGSTISATAGIAMSFSLTASDINNPANPITLTSTGSGIPSGATMTPSLPQTANPVSSTFNWTPSSGDVGQHAAEFKIHDPCTNGNEYCFFTIDVLPASSFCDITNIVLQNISACNNNGTIDTTDDFVTADIVVDFINPPTTANFQIDPISDVYGTYSIPVSSLVGNTHTFTGVHVKADGTAANFKIEFTANSNRCAQALIGAVIPHCPSPCANAVIDDNNNCTIDACEPLTGIVTHTPVVVPDPVISGADAICINTQETYSVPYDDNATYLWTVPTGVNIVSGQGSALIVVQFTSGCQSGNICVMATTPCGNSNTVCQNGRNESCVSPASWQPCRPAFPSPSWLVSSWSLSSVSCP